MPTTNRIAYWLLAGLPAAAFLFASSRKLTGNAAMVENFARFGYPPWFMYFIGAAELSGALGLLFGAVVHPILPRLAAVGLMIIMVGAVVTHVMHDPLVSAASAAVLLAMLGGFLYVARSAKQVSAA